MAKQYAIDLAKERFHLRANIAKANHQTPYPTKVHCPSRTFV